MSEENSNSWLESLDLGSEMIAFPVSPVSPTKDRYARVQPPQEETKKEWQHELLRKYGRSACYAVFLVLPSDRETIAYLSDYGN